MSISILATCNQGTGRYSEKKREKLLIYYIQYLIYFAFFVCFLCPIKICLHNNMEISDIHLSIVERGPRRTKINAVWSHAVASYQHTKYLAYTTTMIREREREREYVWENERVSEREREREREREWESVWERERVNGMEFSKRHHDSSKKVIRKEGRYCKINIICLNLVQNICHRVSPLSLFKIGVSLFLLSLSAVDEKI